MHRYKSYRDILLIAAHLAFDNDLITKKEVRKLTNPEASRANEKAYQRAMRFFNRKSETKEADHASQS